LYVEKDYSEFVPYEQSRELKELGCNEPCFATYELGKIHINEFKNDCSYELCLKTEVFPALTFSQTFHWFEKVHGYHLIVSRLCIKSRRKNEVSFAEYNYHLYPKDSNTYLEDNLLDEYDSKHEAELAALKHLIKLVKQNLI